MTSNNKKKIYIEKNPVFQISREKAHYVLI